MAGACRCALCVLVVMMTDWSATTTTTTSVGDLTQHCLREQLPHDLVEWDPELYRQRGCVVVSWNVPPRTDVSSCIISTCT